METSLITSNVMLHLQERMQVQWLTVCTSCLDHSMPGKDKPQLDRNNIISIMSFEQSDIVKIAGTVH